MLTYKLSNNKGNYLSVVEFVSRYENSLRSKWQTRTVPDYNEIGPITFTLTQSFNRPFALVSIKPYLRECERFRLLMIYCFKGSEEYERSLGENPSFVSCYHLNTTFIPKKIEPMEDLDFQDIFLIELWINSKQNIFTLIQCKNIRSVLVRNRLQVFERMERLKHKNGDSMIEKYKDYYLLWIVFLEAAIRFRGRILVGDVNLQV